MLRRVLSQKLADVSEVLTASTVALMTFSAIIYFAVTNGLPFEPSILYKMARKSVNRKKRIHTFVLWSSGL
jgi:hypothetical protein